MFTIYVEFWSHILYLKDLIRTYFCEIYVILWDLIEIKKTSFQYPNPQPDCTGGRPNGRPDQESADRNGRPMCTSRAQRPAIRPVDRVVDRLKAPYSRVGADRPGGRPLALARSTGSRPEAQRS